MIPKKIVKAVFERDNYCCQYCNQQQPPEQHSLHCHHVKHKSQGGLDTLENLKTACWKCHGDHGKISEIDKNGLIPRDLKK